jgi:hypothetical protein
MVEAAMAMGAIRKRRRVGGRSSIAARKVALISLSPLSSEIWAGPAAAAMRAAKLPRWGAKRGTTLLTEPAAAVGRSTSGPRLQGMRF